ncbi:hypothetical protein [Streptococcus gallolyticus]|uniref:hypothetical protein n=1 Tax=Streptococcus gallolyticus TaxID=315405 RepID=UPI003D6F1894
MTQSNQDFKAQQFHLDANDFNEQALHTLKDTALLASRKELTELILLASSEDDVKAQILTDAPVMALVKLLSLVNASVEQIGVFLTLDAEGMLLLRTESDLLQHQLDKL